MHCTILLSKSNRGTRKDCNASCQGKRNALPLGEGRGRQPFGLPSCLRIDRVIATPVTCQSKCNGERLYPLRLGWQFTVLQEGRIFSAGGVDSKGRVCYNDFRRQDTGSIGELCNGSTYDSDSYCLGSNPSSPAICLHGQAVKTLPSQGKIMGSIPIGGATKGLRY